MKLITAGTAFEAVTDRALTATLDPDGMKPGTVIWKLLVMANPMFSVDQTTSAPAAPASGPT